MKRLFFTLFVIILTQYSNAAVVFRTDTTKVEYQVCGNDTIYLKKQSTIRERTYCGLKQYEENLFAKFHKQLNKIEYGALIDEFNSDDENRVAFIKFVVKKVLEGYGKDRCTEMINKNMNHSNTIQILINVDIEGKIFDLDFSFTPNCTEFMTNEDIIRNTRILKESEPFSYFTDYNKIGAKILPRLVIPILNNFIEDYLEEEATGE